ncbi:glycosyltransferase [Catalinimonas alkaloidigena]|nr:glycosyltransferase [Catalinimonas alkaloidigena]
MITSFPPRECGIATYSEDLINALNSQYEEAFDIKVCALDEPGTQPRYTDPRVLYHFDAWNEEACARMVQEINHNPAIRLIHVQHEFGLFGGEYGSYLLQMMLKLEKPVVLTFHTVLPAPDAKRRELVRSLCTLAVRCTVMTHNSAHILEEEYGIDADQLRVVPHGTPAIAWKDPLALKRKYELEGKTVFSTFGLLSPNKSIETGIEALAPIVQEFPDVVYLILGRTHPGVVRHEGERYREMLEQKVEELGLTRNVRFVNKYLELDELLEYLQLTDVYFFTSADPHQAVSGTFTYALSCGCPVISTPIPHAKEYLSDSTGILLKDFRNPTQLAEAALTLLRQPERCQNMSQQAYGQMNAGSWYNVAILHRNVYREEDKAFGGRSNLPILKMDHLERLSSEFGIYQFARYNQPDPAHGYTLDDNARALILTCEYRQLSQERRTEEWMGKYLRFMRHCQQADGTFLNYVDDTLQFTTQNQEVNLEDANMRAVWALGVLLEHHHRLPVPAHLRKMAEQMLARVTPHIAQVRSPRAASFALKGLYHLHKAQGLTQPHCEAVDLLATHLQSLYRDNQGEGWQWFEPYLTYANSILPEAMLYAYRLTDQSAYLQTARTTMQFLIDKMCTEERIKLIPNTGWLQKGQTCEGFGEQSIDVSYTIHTLLEFEQEFPQQGYGELAELAFSWYVGNNHLQQFVYNPTTGGCHDGVEETNVNLNQGAESTVCYLWARIQIENFRKRAQLPRPAKAQRTQPPTSYHPLPNFRSMPVAARSPENRD